MRAKVCLSPKITLSYRIYAFRYISLFLKNIFQANTITYLQNEQIHPCRRFLPYIKTVLISQGRQVIVGWLEIGRYGRRGCMTCNQDSRERELGRWKSDHGRSQQYRRAVAMCVFGYAELLERLSPAQGD